MCNDVTFPVRNSSAGRKVFNSWSLLFLFRSDLMLTVQIGKLRQIKSKFQLLSIDSLLSVYESAFAIMADVSACFDYGLLF